MGNISCVGCAGRVIFDPGTTVPVQCLAIQLPVLLHILFRLLLPAFFLRYHPVAHTSYAAKPRA